MLYFSEYFTEAKSRIAKYKNETIYQCDIYDKVGLHNVKLEIISTNSSDEQAVILDLRQFKGNIYNTKGEIYPIPKNKYPTLDIYESIWKDVAYLRIELISGNIGLYNGSLINVGLKKIVKYGSEGCAMKIEELSLTKKRYYCNDFGNDDDFDDLVFEMEIID